MFQKFVDGKKLLLFQQECIKLIKSESKDWYLQKY